MSLRMGARALCGWALLALAACSADKPKPTPLETFEPRMTGSQVWTTRVGGIGFPMMCPVVLDQPGGGFTHHLGDQVRISSPYLGVLQNRVSHCQDAAPWQFGLRAWVNNLAQRGLLGGGNL